MKKQNTSPKKRKAINSTILIAFVLSSILMITGSYVYAATPKENAVTYMKWMATQIWKPAADLSIKYKVVGDVPYYTTYTKGTIYRGIPYSQMYVTPLITSSSVSNEYGFRNKMSFYSGYYNLSSAATGNDCCDAVLMAWRSVGFSISPMGRDDWYSGKLSTTAISNRNAPSGIKLIGTSKFSSGGTISEIYSGVTSTTANEAYGMLTMGDALVNDGHVMMVVSVSGSSVTIVDQYIPKYANNCSWRNDQSVSFSTLYSEKYIPITIS